MGLESDRNSDRNAFDATTEPNGWKLRDYQHTGREFIRARRGILLADQMRLGKAQPLDAKILTPTGWRLMGDLIVGDEIVDPDGGVAYVEAIYPQGVKPLFEVLLASGAKTCCCAEHLWLTGFPVPDRSEMQLRALPTTMLIDPQPRWLPQMGNSNFDWTRIVHVKSVPAVEAQCIKVSSKRSLYITDDYIVTHNTAQLVSSHEPSDGPLIVVAPLATREVWLGWFRRRWPDIRPTVLQGKYVAYVDPKKAPKRKRERNYDLLEGEFFDESALKNAQLVFMNYDILAGWKNFGNRRVGTLVFDEIHLLSNKGSRRSKAAMFLAAQAERVIGATGTPLWNKPAGLFTTLACISPGAWGKYFEYASRYANGRMGPHGFVADGASNEEEFRVRMQEIMLRRTWQSVLGEVPVIERTVEVVQITERQAFKVEKEAERVRDHAVRSTAIGAMARFRRLLAQLKLDGSIDVAKRVLDGGERVIVWTWHRDIAIKIEEALAKQGFPGFVVTGSTNPDIRAEIFDRWRAHPAAPLCITLSVGQVGIDLSAARQEVFAELDYTPSIVAQAEMRPFNGKQPIAATYVIIDHEIERKILEALQTKCDFALRLGIPAAESAIEVIASGFTGVGGGLGTADDFAALANAVLTDHPDEDEGDNDYHGTMWTLDMEAE